MIFQLICVARRRFLPGLLELLTSDLADQLLFVQQRRLLATYRPPSAIAQLAHIQLQLSDCPAKRVTVHAQFAGRLALVPPVLLQDVHNEALLKLPHGF